MDLIKMKLAEPGLIAANTASEQTSPHLEILRYQNTRVISSNINIVAPLNIRNPETNFDVCRRRLRITYKCRPASLRSKITCQGTNN